MKSFSLLLPIPTTSPPVPNPLLNHISLLPASDGLAPHRGSSHFVLILYIAAGCHMGITSFDTRITRAEWRNGKRLKRRRKKKGQTVSENSHKYKPTGCGSLGGWVAGVGGWRGGGEGV